MPVSRTSMRTPSSTRSATTATDPPSGVYLVALSARFPSTADSASRLVNACSSGGTSTKNAIFLVRAASAAVTTASGTTLDSSTSSRGISSRRASIL